METITVYTALFNGSNELYVSSVTGSAVTLTMKQQTGSPSMSAQSCLAGRTWHDEATEPTSSSVNNSVASPACNNQIQRANSLRWDLLRLKELSIFILGPHDCTEKPQLHKTRLQQAEPCTWDPAAPEKNPNSFRGTISLWHGVWMTQISFLLCVFNLY